MGGRVQCPHQHSPVSSAASEGALGSGLSGKLLGRPCALDLLHLPSGA